MRPRAVTSMLLTGRPSYTKVEFEAESLWAAKQKAVAKFKPAKKDAGYVWVALAEVDGEAVAQVAVD